MRTVAPPALRVEDDFDDDPDEDDDFEGDGEGSDEDDDEEDEDDDDEEVETWQVSAVFPASCVFLDFRIPKYLD
jgi:hypothetical protein